MHTCSGSWARTSTGRGTLSALWALLPRARADWRVENLFMSMVVEEETAMALFQGAAVGVRMGNLASERAHACTKKLSHLSRQQQGAAVVCEFMYRILCGSQQASEILEFQGGLPLFCDACVSSGHQLMMQLGITQQRAITVTSYPCMRPTALVNMS
eukprot:521229-Pelagomonas_calceolata.AAC.3